MKQRIITDTADRIRTSDMIRVNGKRALVLDVAAVDRIGRIALTVCDPHGALTDLDDRRTVQMWAGEIVTFEPHSTHLMDAVGRRPGAAH